MFVTIDTENK